MKSIMTALHDYAEIRSSARAELFVEVDIASDSNFYLGFAENVSEGGLFVATQRLYELGTFVAIQLSLPGLGRRIETTCEVRWGKVGDDSGESPSGVGLQFCGLSPEDAQAIRDFVGQREPMFWE